MTFLPSGSLASFPKSGPLHILFSFHSTINKNQGAQAMAWNTIWTIFGDIYSHLEPLRVIRGKFGAIWCNLETFQAIWSNFEPFGAIWSNVEPF